MSKNLLLKISSFELLMLQIIFGQCVAISPGTQWPNAVKIHSERVKYALQVRFYRGTHSALLVIF